jgi:hypothetical protein
MKDLKFKTIAGRCHSQSICIFNFLEYFRHCGVHGLEIKNSLALYLNNVNEAVFNADVPYDSVLPESIELELELDKEFRKRYLEINDMLKFNI